MAVGNVPAKTCSQSLDQGFPIRIQACSRAQAVSASQHQLEAEARLVQVLPPIRWRLFWQLHGDQIEP